MARAEVVALSEPIQASGSIGAFRLTVFGGTLRA
jgi:hypothetical protein